jgi:hypothetical protein
VKLAVVHLMGAPISVHGLSGVQPMPKFAVNCLRWLGRAMTGQVQHDGELLPTL